MTGTRVNAERQKRPLCSSQQTKKPRQKGSWLPPPPPRAREAVVSSLSIRPLRSLNSQMAKGAFQAVTFHTDPRERGQRKESLVRKGGRVPLLVPLWGTPQARPLRVELTHPAGRIRWVAFIGDKKTCYGYS